MPPSYSVIYQVHLLNDDELQIAIESGLLRPDVRRDQIEQLRLKRGYSKLRAQPTLAAPKDQVQDVEPIASTADCEPELSDFR